MLPFALTITFALTASLVVALTVVPTMGSAMLKHAEPKKHGIFDRIQEAYAGMLSFCLRFKAVPLGISVALLVFCIAAVVRMGIVLIPNMGSDQISVNVTMPEEDQKETAFAKADEVMQAILSIEGVGYIGMMDAGSAAGLMGGMAGGSEKDYGSFSYYVLPEEDYNTKEQVEEICDAIRETTKEMDCEIAVSNSMMGEMEEMLGSGLEIEIGGAELDTLLTVSEDVVGMLEKMEGFEKDRKSVV